MFKNINANENLKSIYLELLLSNSNALSELLEKIYMLNMKIFSTQVLLNIEF